MKKKARKEEQSNEKKPTGPPVKKEDPKINEKKAPERPKSKRRLLP